MDNLLPWEKEIYVTLLVKFLEEENEKLRQKEANRKKRR